MTKFRRTVESASEYKEVVAHAEALGFEAVKHYAAGKWEDNDGHGVWPAQCDVEKVGRKYFHIPMVGPNGKEAFPVRPVYSSSSTGQNGSLEITFEESR